MKKLISIFISLMCLFQIASSQNYNFSFAGEYYGNFHGLYPHIVIKLHDDVFSISPLSTNSAFKFTEYSITGNTITGKHTKTSTQFGVPDTEATFSITLADDKLSFSGYVQYLKDSVLVTDQVYCEREKGYISCPISTDDGGGLENHIGFSAKLINYSDSLTAPTIVENSGPSWVFFEHVYSSNLTVVPESPLYTFEPMYADFLPFVQFDQVPFVAQESANVFLKCDLEVIPFSTEIVLTIEIRDTEGNLIDGVFEGKVEEMNKVPWGYFSGMGSVFKGEKGIATVTYKTPAASTVGEWGGVKFLVRIFGYPETADLSLSFDKEGFKNIWAEPKHPDHPSLTSKTAIIPATSTFPAQLFASAEDSEGNPIQNEKFTFKIEGNDYGELSNEEGSETGNEIKVETNIEGIATVFYSFKSGAPSIEPVIQKIKVVEDKTGKSGLLEIKCGLGLNVKGIQKYETTGGIITPNKKIALVVGIESEFYPGLDIKTYAALAQEFWGKKELGVHFSIDWKNQPENLGASETDLTFNGLCGFDRLNNPPDKLPPNILYALEPPWEDVGSSHMFPAIVPKTNGPRIYVVKAAIADVGNPASSGEVAIKVTNSMVGFNVSYLSEYIEPFLCAWGATTYEQHQIIEATKKFWEAAQVGYLADILDIFDVICKWYKGDNLGAALSAVSSVGKKVIAKYAEDLEKGGSFTDSEKKLILKASQIKEDVSDFDNFQKEYNFLLKKIPKSKEKSALLYNSNEENELSFTKFYEHNDLLLSLKMAQFTHELLKTGKAVLVYNVSDAKSELNGQPALEFDEENLGNISDLMFSQSDNTYGCSFEKNETIQLNFTANDSTLVVVFEGGSFTFYKYCAFGMEGAKCSLEVNPDNSGVLQIDTDADNNPDLVVEGEKVELIEEDTGGGGGSGPISNYNQEWLNVFGSRGNDNIQDIGVDLDGNVYLVGHFNSTSVTANNEILANVRENNYRFLSMFSPNGELEWTHFFENGDDNAFVNDCSFFNLNNKTILLMNLNSNTSINGQVLNESNKDNIVTVEVNPNGELNNIQKYIVDDLDDVKSYITSDSEIFLAGSAKHNFQIGEKEYDLSSNEQLVLAQLKDNIILFDSVYQFGGEIEEVLSMTVDSEKNYYINIEYEQELNINRNVLSIDDNDKNVTLKIDKNGAILWFKVLSSPGIDECKIAIDNEDNLIFYGTVNENSFLENEEIPNIESGDGFIAKLTSSGEILDIKNFGGESWDRLYDITFDNENNYYCAFTTNSDSIYNWENVPDEKVAVVKLDKNLEYLWHGEIESPDIETEKIILTPQNHIVLAGIFEEQISFNDKTFVNFDGNSTSDDIFIASFIPEILTKNTNFSNQPSNIFVYPNPAQSEITIQPVNVLLPPSTIYIYSINGKLIKQISTNQRLINCKVNLNSLMNGIHLIKVENDQFSEIKKIIINR